MPGMPAIHGNAIALGTAMTASKKRCDMLSDCVMEAGSEGLSLKKVSDEYADKGIEDGGPYYIEIVWDPERATQPF